MRTPLHFNPATGKRERYWIGREYKNRTEAERALRKWHTDREAGTLIPRSDMTMGQLMDGWLAKHRGEDTTKEGYEPKIRLHIKPHGSGLSSTGMSAPSNWPGSWSKRATRTGCGS
ncbi:hypothetical protein ACF1GS_22880 [Streptomyces eurythermus]|uniref:hypothetical protein n=1 Tax=Streptomyces eurythermus TaxID=42237 RepID=UPI0036FCB84D